MYRNRKLKKREFSEYEGLIPETYIEQLRAGKFYAGLVTDIVGEVETTEMLYITYPLADWLEIVWVHYYNEENTSIAMANLLRYMIRVERTRNDYKPKGMFWEISEEEASATPFFKDSLLLCGFECHETVDNIYEFSLDMVKDRDILVKAANTMNVIPVSEAGQDIRDTLDTMVQQDKRPVPVGMYIDWDSFLPKESMICIKNGLPCGVLLLSNKQDYIVVECAYVTHEPALIAMLGKAFTVLENSYGPDQKMLVPVIRNRTGAMIRKMVPDVTRGKRIEGILWF